MNQHPAQRRRRRSGISRSGLAALLSVAGHVLFVLLLLLLSYVEVRLPGGRPQRAPDRPISMRPIASSQWDRNRGQDAPNQPPTKSLPPPKKEEKKKPPEEHPKGQVVDVQPGNNEESPDAKYLAETSNKTKRESKSKDQTPNYRNAMPKKSSTTPQTGQGHDEAAHLSGNHGVGADDAPRREAGKNKQTMEIPSQHAQQEIALRKPTSPDGPGLDVNKHDESEEIKGNSQRLKIAPGGEEGEEASAGRMGEPGAPNLIPSAAVLDKLSGAAPNDHLEDVDEGNGTYLNTKEWKYASFFNRVKQSVGLQWNPSTTLRQRDPSGQIYGGKDRFTLLTITLLPNGTVKEVYVEKSSGLDFLDLEAVKSFERAQPFPNPPPGLLTSDSTVKFSFGFFVEMGGGPRMRLFRAPN